MKAKSITIVFENLDEITFPISEVKTLTFYQTISVDRLVGKKFEKRKVAITACIQISNLLNTLSVVTNSGFTIDKYTASERLMTFHDICSIYINLKSGKRLEYLANWPETASDEENPYQHNKMSDDKDSITIQISPTARKSLEEMFEGYDENAEIPSEKQAWGE